MSKIILKNSDCFKLLPKIPNKSIDITFGDIENVHPIIKFPVDEDEGVYSMDQNFQELLDAYYSHQNIFLTCNGQEYAYEKYDSSTHTFYFTSTLADSIKTFVLVGDYSTGEWTSITLEETFVNNDSDLFNIIMTLTTDPQTEEQVYSVDKTPSEVVAAYNSNKIIQIVFNNFYIPLLSSSITTEGTAFIFSTSTPVDNNGVEYAHLLLTSNTNENVWNDISSQSYIYKSDRSFMPEIYLSPTTNEYRCMESFQEFEDAYNLLSNLRELSHMGVKYDSQVYRLEKYDD